jgi:hypothetical protein
MALEHMILVPPDLVENGSQAPTPPVKQILKLNDYSYIKWTQVRLHQDLYLKTEKRKRQPIPIPTVKTGGTLDSNPSFQAKPKRKSVISSGACV